MSTEKGIRRLRKSHTDRIIAGVCGGVAEYFQIDSTIVRVLWVLATIFGGWGLLLYIVALFIMPKATVFAQNESAGGGTRTRSETSSAFWGILLIGIGIVLLLGHHGFPFWFHWWGFGWKGAAGIAMLLGGVLLLIRPFSGSRGAARQDSATEGEHGAAPWRGVDSTEGLKRSQSEKIVAGVCGGIGQYLNVDPVIVRLLFVLAAFGSIGLVAVTYIVLAIVVPREELQRQPVMA